VKYNCIPYWELSAEEQNAIDTFLAVDYAQAGHEYPWGKNGDFPESEESPARCRKCGQKRLRFNEDNQYWCRRCRYYFFYEYFGPDAVND
jgi:DNA-directed RNA polymerase subunit RPC12/RpoP